MLPTRPPSNVAPEATRKAVARNDETLLRQLAARPWSPASARAAQGLGLDNAARRSLLDPGDPLIAVDLERAACASAALFAALAAGAGAELEVPLPHSDETVTMTGAAPHPNLGDPIYWRTGLLAALAVRKRRAIELLAGIPLDLLRQLAPADPPWALREREALQALALGRRDAPDLLVAAAAAADPKTAPDLARDWVLDVVTPELQLGFRALARDQAGVDQWMTEAIKGHHHYYFQRPDRRNDLMAQLALAPLAMACVAHDMGVRTSVATDYVPARVIA
ncbi:MAG TPA: immunity 49 family protein [Kofleriaceae bacterium]|nr:immunity 49 family protein [Kofleriaceae bacterium]